MTIDLHATCFCVCVSTANRTVACDPLQTRSFIKSLRNVGRTVHTFPGYDWLPRISRWSALGEYYHPRQSTCHPSKGGRLHLKMLGCALNSRMALVWDLSRPIICAGKVETSEFCQIANINRDHDGGSTDRYTSMYIWAFDFDDVTV